MRLNPTKLGTLGLAHVLMAAALTACGGSGADNAEQRAATAGDNETLQEKASNTAAATSTVVVRAWGSLANGTGPLVDLRVNGVVVASAEVRATAYQDYSFTVPAVPGGARVDVVFTNDAMLDRDRNLFVESITIDGATIPATAEGVVLDRGLGDKAFDGMDVLPGQRSVLWNGALRFVAPGATVLSRLSPGCTTFYENRPGFALSTARSVDTAPTLSRPAKGAALAEPNYQTCLTRAADHQADRVSGFARNDYSRRQAFNADSSKHLVAAIDGHWHLYDALTHTRVKVLPYLAGDAEPQWHATQPDLLYYLPTNGMGMQINELNTATGATRVIGDLGARLKARWPGANAAWTKSEGSPSKDGRYWCLMVDDSKWNSLGVITWDRDSDTVVGWMNTNGERPDHVSMSPSGNYCVVSGDGARGTVAYSRDFSQQTRLLHKSEHSDLAIDANGDDVYVAVDYQSNAGDIFMTNLRTGVRTALLSSYANGSATALHISGKAFNRPGWVVLSTYGGTGSTQWFHKKIMAVELKPNPQVYNLAFSRTASNGYWTEPVASVNRDFTKVLFNSNWGNGSSTDVDAYMVQIPSGALKASAATPTNPGTPTTPTPTPVPNTPPTITVGSATHSGYNASYVLTTNEAAACRASWSSGNAYGALYDEIPSSANGLTHSKSLSLGSTAAQTVYAVCKSKASGLEKEVAIRLP
ncbi:carbohydrate-binding domain-containing protein [Acidovorax sp.]|uniref:carbohydrate-binding domain-containing protein n=1 Tax=Acidovorax sp. TaxID=1872122 RepID=UPI00391BF9A9